MGAASAGAVDDDEGALPVTVAVCEGLGQSVEMAVAIALAMSVVIATVYFILASLCVVVWKNFESECCKGSYKLVTAVNCF